MKRTLMQVYVLNSAEAVELHQEDFAFITKDGERNRVAQA